MTTMCYDHKAKTIAVDSRTTGGMFCYSDDQNKINRVKDMILILTGDVADIQYFLENFEFAIRTKITEELSISGICVYKNEVYQIWYSENYCKLVKIDYNIAVGSGSSFAISALDLGKSAKESIEYVKTRDVSTGGKVRVIKLK